MARKDNFLLGNGQKLTMRVEVPSSGGPKNPPYPFTEARERFQRGANTVANAVRALPRAACPGGETVLSVTMHPRYVSKSDFPTPLFNALGLRPIGSKTISVKPDKWGIKEPPPGLVPTDEIFVAGAIDRILQLGKSVESFVADTTTAGDLSHIEAISFQSPEAKLKNIAKGESWLEVVLHNNSNINVLSVFSRYANELGARVDINRSRRVSGLTFVPVSATGPVSQQIARFSFLRVARSMPTLRPMRPPLLRAAKQRAVLPTEDAISSDFRVLIFDGGIPPSALPSLSRWVNLILPTGIGPSIPDLESHGLAVTSAFLFGTIENIKDLKRPVCGVDHVRVLDTAMLSSSDPYYFDVLDRIVQYFDANGGKYNLINLSMGPNLPCDDGDVTLWTSSLDERLASGQWVVTVAAGNDGEADSSLFLDRVQPPGDGVNVLTVGASDSMKKLWKRASYSCPGPGRSPGFVKPDGLAFGGSGTEPFRVLSPILEVEGIEGTSVASPFAMRSAASVKAQIGDSLDSLAIRALMIHTTQKNDLELAQGGWGRFEPDPERLITCEDHEALVIYREELPIGEYLRAPIPLPDTLKGKITISATLLIATEVDPGHPSAYTRSGLTVSFRPHSDKYTEYDDGKKSSVPKTNPFFSQKNMYGVGESELREDGHKWEPVRHGSLKFYPNSLKRPCFDIYNDRRFEGVATTALTKTKYALVVTVSAKKMPNLYSGIVRAYSNILIPLRPKIRIEL
jgi:hypothetical protein